MARSEPSGSIRIRVETIDYFLRRYREDVIARRKAAESIERELAEYATRLRNFSLSPLAAATSPSELTSCAGD